MRPYLHLFLCFLLFLFLKLPAHAQSSSIRGYVRAADSGEPLIGATVSVPALGKGTVTDVNGYYMLPLPAGEHTLQASYIGYTPITRRAHTPADGKNKNIVFLLEPANNELKEVEIASNSLRQRLNDTRMSMEVLTTREAKLLPALFGEVDLVKAMQLKPGIQASSEGSTGMYVRGGGADQNLMQLDGTTIYNASHLFGFFSVFNPESVKSVELYKGGFPAQFGGRLSSVVDVTLNEGNNERVGTAGSLGLISSKLTIDGPIKKDKANFIVSGRRTYVDVFTRQINRLSEDNEDYSPIPDYYFYDLSGKLNYQLDDENKLTLSAYYGRDFFSFSEDGFNFGFDWGNRMANLRWEHKFSDQLFASASVNATKYNYNLKNAIDAYSLKLTSDIEDYTFKTDFDWFLEGGHSLKFGSSVTRHYFGIGHLNVNSDDDRLNYTAGNNYHASEFGVYASDDYQINALFSLNYGLRLSAFNSGGRTYTGLEPRISAKYNLDENTAIKGSYASMMQYVHLVSNSGATLPTDVWYPSTKNVEPQRSQQIALGFTKLFARGRFLLTNEAYYKWMHNQLDFRDGANLFLNNNLEAEFLFGKGNSYGNELYLEKVKGKTTGWLGYTLSWTFRQFDEINGGRPFPTRYDRRHDVSLVLMHKLNKRLSVTASFVYGSGTAYSLPVARFAFQDMEGKGASMVPIYEERNGFRLPPTHRLDLGAVLKLKSRHGEADLTFGVYNVYNRRNPYFVYIDHVKDEESSQITGFQAKQVSLFPVVPSITYNFKF
ncbi:TonB-dependent receptor [Pontibacter ummariensis]|nr:TonB-dependent receptor [Pontibacter ummariensis]